MKIKKNYLLSILISSVILLAGCLTESDKIDYKELMARYEASEELSVKKKFPNLINDFKEEDLKLFEIYRKLINVPLFIERYKDLKIVFINILDKDNKPGSGMTVKSENDHLIIEKGFDCSCEPILVLNLSNDDIIDLYNYFSDNIITDKEEFYLSNLFLIPSYESMFRNKDFIFLTNERLIKFQTPIFLTLQNKKKYPLQADKDNTKITVYNDGCFQVKKGHHGFAYYTLQIDPAKTLRYFNIVSKILNEKDLKKKIKLLKRTPYEFVKIYLF